MLPLLLALHLVDSPCVGCRVTLPDDVAKPPLLVVLHGDFGTGAAPVATIDARSSATTAGPTTGLDIDSLHVHR